MTDADESTESSAQEAQEESCPTCGAGSGMPCRSGVGGVLIGVHASRMMIHKSVQKAKIKKKK
jgi:hypothetical protein